VTIPPARVELGPVAVAIATVVGARVGEARGASGAVGLLVTGAAGLLCAWIVRGAARAAAVALACALLAAGSMQRALDGLEHHALAEATGAGRALVVRGTAAADPDPGRWSVEVLMRVRDFRLVSDDRWQRLDRTVLVRAAPSDVSRLRVLEAGDRIEVTGYAAPLGPRDARLRWRHAVAALTRGQLVGMDAPGGALGVVNRVRGLVARGSSVLDPAAGGLLRGLVLGDTSGLTRATVGAFRDAGLSHLLAVSGANVAFVLALAAPALRRFRLGLRAVVAMSILAAFVLVTRWEPSVLRAATMSACAMAAGVLGRPASSTRLLAHAVVVLVVADPFLVHSLGFALSVAAAGGIVVLAPAIERRLPGPAVVRAPLAVTLAAQVAVTPLLLTSVGAVPAVAPIANLLAAPLAEPVTMIGLPAAVVAGALAGAAPPVAALVLVPVEVLVDALAAVASAASAARWQLGGRELAGLLAVGSLVTAAVRAVRRWRPSLPRR
jgi:competence protein ComEC